ncbi:efflux RND transporter periplasmic adaptor subunit [Telmatospirillum sp.]|uniref:efflux RND transporter periplasmic adaptor subunit n=1 Tax=Telmatospirillum sp. TaxID=2079197 RepID=UPI00283DCC1F|nr:efflux RND transporter periplasmic adaptor subunit [Telmatospirillum sp.]MDR3441322.1 efflux RND transporter periplasmic adaptor subunit [Telmatospirillum sp.]
MSSCAFPVDRPIERRPFLRRHGGVIGLCVALLVGGGYGCVHFGLHRRASVDWDRLTVAAVVPGTFHDYIPVTGAVQPLTIVYLDVAQGGQVAERLVEEGTVVAAGQPLVKFRNAALELQVTGDEAQLAERLFQLSSVNLQLEDARLQHQRDLAAVEANINALSLQLGRLRPLLAEGYAKRAEVEDAEVSLERSRRERAAVAAAHALDQRLREAQTRQLTEAMAQLQRNHAMAQRTLDDLTVRAPISGQLTALDAEVGAFKTSGQRIGQIDGQDAFKVTALVDEFYLNRVSTGQQAAADLDGRTYSLTVARIRPEVKNRQFPVDLSFNEGTPPSVRRGQTLQLRLEIGSPADGLVVANGAFFNGSGGQLVFVVTPAGDRANRRHVSFGRHNPQTVEVLAGLAAGERIVTSSTADFGDLDTLDIRNGSSAIEREPRR